MTNFFSKHTIRNGTILFSIVLFVFLFDFIARRVVVGYGIGLLSEIIEWYRDYFGFIASKTFGIFCSKASYNQQTNTIFINEYAYILTNEIGLLKLFYFVLLVLIYPLKINKSLALFFIGFTIMLLLLIIRLSFFATYTFENRIISIFFDSVFSIFYLFVFFYKTKQLIKLKRFYVNLQFRINQLFVLSLKKILFILATFSFIAELLLLFITKWLTQQLLQLTNWGMHSFGYNTHIINNRILWDNCSVIVGPPCLGVRLMMLYAFFILFIKGTAISKYIFIPMGILIISFLNVIRISYLLYHLHFYRNVPIAINMHNAFDITIYIVMCFLWYIYMKWFRFFPKPMNTQN